MSWRKGLGGVACEAVEREWENPRLESQDLWTRRVTLGAGGRGVAAFPQGGVAGRAGGQPHLRLPRSPAWRCELRAPMPLSPRWKQMRVLRTRAPKLPIVKDFKVKPLSHRKEEKGKLQSPFHCVCVVRACVLSVSGLGNLLQWA